jgi:hypothetical protein
LSKAQTPADKLGTKAALIKEYEPDTGDPPEDKGYDAGRADGIAWAKGAICSFLERSAHNEFEQTCLRLRAQDIMQGRVVIV